MYHAMNPAMQAYSAQMNGTLTNECLAGSEATLAAALNYVLGATALIVLALDVGQLIRLFFMSRQTGLAYNGKRFFHVVLGISLLGRVIFFIISPFLCAFKASPAIQLFIWSNHTLEVLFFCAFFLLLIFWVDLISSLQREPSRKRAICQKTSLGIFLGLLLATICLFLLLALVWANSNSRRVLILDIYYASVVDVLELGATAMFLAFGWVLFSLLRRHDELLTVNVEKKKAMALNIAIVTLLVAVCFSFRIGVSIYSLTLEFSGTANAYDVPPLVFFLYFFLPEIVGSLLMLYLLRIPRPKQQQLNNIQDYKRII